MSRKEARGRLRVGTSGWSYADWAKGRFYPKGLNQREWLGYYAKHFSTVEVNMTFYRLPTAAQVAHWMAATPSRFRFAVKLWRAITHYRRLQDCEDLLDTFFDRLEPLRPKQGPLLVQLPPNMHADTDTLDRFLTVLRKKRGRARWPIVVEFRNTEWLTDEITDVLDKHSASRCVADMPRCKTTQPNDEGAVYIRRHGPQGTYRAKYSSRAIQRHAESVRGWLDQGRDVYVYYNNDVEGYAIDNAQELLAAVEK